VDAIAIHRQVAAHLLSRFQRPQLPKKIFGCGAFEPTDDLTTEAIREHRGFVVVAMAVRGNWGGVLLGVVLIVAGGGMVAASWEAAKGATR
jgi:hypothetical protein